MTEWRSAQRAGQLQCRVSRPLYRELHYESPRSSMTAQDFKLMKARTLGRAWLPLETSLAVVILVSLRDQRRRVAIWIVRCHDTAASRQGRDGHLGGDAQLLLSELPKDSVIKYEGLSLSSRRHYHHDFVTGVVLPICLASPADARADRLQVGANNVVGNRVTVAVVYRLQIVHVEKGYRTRVNCSGRG